jgi:hypothetical protein
MIYKTNTPDYYLHHLYTQYNKDLQEHYNRLQKTVPFKIGTAYGNFQISTKDLFCETGAEGLRFKSVGYGKLQLMGAAVFFKDKNLTDLYYKTTEYKKAVENFVQGVDHLNEAKQENVKYIEEQHGKPRIQHSIIWARVTGLV